MVKIFQLCVTNAPAHPCAHDIRIPIHHFGNSPAIACMDAGKGREPGCGSFTCNLCLDLKNFISSSIQPRINQRFLKLLIVFLGLFYFTVADAHHVLGRPSYSISADSNTPPSMQVETQIGEFYVTYMAFPAFPKPDEPGRINLYASRIDNGNTFEGEVTFKVKDNSWFSDKEEILGVQIIDDGVYRQGFVFKQSGNYIITAEFESGGEPYEIDFPLQIGDSAPIGPLGLAVSVIVLVIVGVNIAQRRRLQRMKAQQHHADKV